MRVFAYVQDPGPDLLVDNLIRGFVANGVDVSLATPRPHINSAAPILRMPMLACWGGSGWRYAQQSIDEWLSKAAADDVLITTQPTAFDDPDGQKSADFALRYADLPCRKLAIDSYDKPMYGWRAIMAQAGWKVAAREFPQPNEVGLDYAYNPLWTPRGHNSRPVGALFAGDFGVGYRAALRKRFDAVDVPNPITGTLTPADWIDALAQARVCVVPHGAGEKTYRLWEAAAAGCALLVQAFSGDNQPEGLVDGENCVIFHDEEDFTGKLRTLVFNTALSLRLGCAAREEAEANHTPAAIAKRLLEAL